MKTPTSTKAAAPKKAVASGKKSSATKPLKPTTATAASSSAEGVENTPAGSPKPAREDQIAERAYHIWLQQGCPDGSHQQHWHEAEQAIGSGDATA